MMLSVMSMESGNKSAAPDLKSRLWAKDCRELKPMKETNANKACKVGRRIILCYYIKSINMLQ